MIERDRVTLNQDLVLELSYLDLIQGFERSIRTFTSRIQSMETYDIPQMS